MSRSDIDDRSVPDAMTVSQLAARAGVPVRRIRYYVSEELLPPPNGRGRAAHYTRRHLEILQHIGALREVNLSLEEIRARLADQGGAVIDSEGLPATSQPWRRWEIIPGVEMHARDDLDEQTLSTIRVMVGAVRHVLISGDGSADDGVEPGE